jgi:hypothetical protein
MRPQHLISALSLIEILMSQIRDETTVREAMKTFRPLRMRFVLGLSLSGEEDHRIILKSKKDSQETLFEALHALQKRGSVPLNAAEACRHLEHIKLHLRYELADFRKKFDIPTKNKELWEIEEALLPRLQGLFLLREAAIARGDIAEKNPPLTFDTVEWKDLEPFLKEEPLLNHSSASATAA